MLICSRKPKCDATKNQVPYHRVSCKFSSPEMRGLIENELDELTPIQRFYSGANVFITGGTGFLGKILIEKLLRSCPDISTLYLLVRSKKGKDMHTRIDELFDDDIFAVLKQQSTKFRHKVVGIGGDCGLPELGLSMQDRQLLIDEVNVVFHVAATVRFDEKLRLAVAINVKGPLAMLNLCKEMKHLKSLVHVSTAFAQCDLAKIEEQIYPPPMDYKKLIAITDASSERLLENITMSVLDQFPNTYAFTKAVAEDVIDQESHGLPIAIYRPSIVISTYREPIKGWINNLYGPTGVCAGAGTGVLRTLHCNPSVNANVIPVDMCVNALISTAWDAANIHEKCKEEKYEIPVYQFESSTDQPINWGRFMHYSGKYGINFPSVKAIWYYCLSLNKHYTVHWLAMMFFHLLPAILSDATLIIQGKSPKLVKIYKKIHRFTDVISYFCTRNWNFHSERVGEMIGRMSKEDQELFFCDLKKLVWEDFFKEYLKGIRIYLLQDPMHTIDVALVKWRRLYWLHQGSKVLFFFLLLRTIWWFCAFLLQSF